MKKRLLSVFLIVVMAMALLPQGVCADGFARSRTYRQGQFADVPSNAWYAAAVKDSYELGLMSGSRSDAFNPSGMFTVAETVTVAARLHSIYSGGNGTFQSGGGAWYAGAVRYALQNGIITYGQFRDYGQDITRAEMAGVIARALPDSQWTAKNNVTALPDVADSTDCSDAIFKLYNAGVFGGSDEYGAFQPYAYITRAEVAAIVARCADPSQRLTLRLTPLSEMEPVVIDNFTDYLLYINDDFSMSEGLLRVQNTTNVSSMRFGYMNYKGEIVIPYQFTSAGDFSNGLAVVSVPDYGASVINTKGQLLIPRGYDEVVSNGCYLIASSRKSCTLYNFEGEYLTSLDGSDYGYRDRTADEIDHADNNPLLKIKHGNKWALATVEGEITDAVYDQIYLVENSNFAVLKIGKMEALAGPNGIIFNLGEYTYGASSQMFCAVGNYIRVNSKDKGDAIADITGNTTEFYPHIPGDGLYMGNGLLTSYISSFWDCFAYDTATGQTYTNGLLVHTSENFISHMEFPDGMCLLRDGTWCRSVEKQDVINSRVNFGSYYCIYQSLDGKYGLSYDGLPLENAVYDSPEEVWENYGYYKKETIGGKPAVVYGNERRGFTPVIQFTGNNLPYDKIIGLGENYYACKFNETWYLVHA